MNSSRPLHYDAIIVGAGAIGAATALLLAESVPEGKILIVERAQEPLVAKCNNLRVWALGHAASALLLELGVFTQFTPNSCHPYSAMEVCDANSQGVLHFDAADYQQSELGFMVDADVCTELLQTSLQGKRNIDVLYDFQCSALNLNRDHASLSGTVAGQQENFTASLIIAADGSNSWVRQQAKIFAPAHTYKQFGIVTNISTEKSHNNVAWQRFLASGPLAVLPLAASQSSIVWSADNDLANDLLALDEAEFAKHLEEAMQSRLGKISLNMVPVSFPLQSRHAERYYKPNLVLLGDAAHSIHPLAGQGANLGFKDAIALASLLGTINKQHWGDISILKRYQRQRRPDNLQTDTLMTLLYRAFKYNAPLWTLARGRGMEVVENSAMLKQLLASQAMGL